MIRSENEKMKNKININSININITVQASSSKTEFQILLNLTKYLEDTSMYFSVIYTETPCLGTIKFVLESSLHFGS